MHVLYNYYYYSLSLPPPSLSLSLSLSDNLQEGYNTLQNIVMAYGDISPETPLTLSLSASRPTTQHTSTTFSLSDIPTHDGVFTQHPLIVPPSTSAPATAAAVLPRPWSRPSSSGSVGLAPPLFSSSGHHSKLKKVSERILGDCVNCNYLSF